MYRVTPYGSRWVVPKKARFQIVRLNHDDVGHFAGEKTLDLISQKYWFPHMRRFVNKYIKNCLNCLYFKSTGNKKPGYLHPIPKIARPFHTLHIDHLGPFIRSKNGNTQVLVIIDAFTKFIFIYPVPNTKTKFVISALEEVIKVFGAPNRIISDRGKAFTSHKFQQFCKSRGTVHYLNAVGLPRGNGQVERYNRTIIDSLSTMGANGDDDEWDQNIVNIQLGLNGSINKALNASPSEVLLGFRVSGQVAYNPPELTNSVDVSALRSQIIANTENYQAQQKQHFDEKRCSPVSYHVGDLILMRITSLPATGSSRKLLPKWKGPFRVSKILGNDRYEVREIPGMTRSQQPYIGVTAIENMKPWIQL